MTPAELLHNAAVRTVARYLSKSGCVDVRIATDGRSLGEGVDLSYVRDGAARRAKVKSDPYFGTDPALIADRSLPFYRADSRSYALETISDAGTRAPGWALTSEADELLYLFLAITSTEVEMAALVAAPDDVFFSRLPVERDELHALPMSPLRSWLSSTQEAYPARPVTAGPRASWIRLVPTADVAGAGIGVRVLGSVFARARG